MKLQPLEKLNDREEDIELIRKQWLKEKHQHLEQKSDEKESVVDEQFVRRLESLQIKYDFLKRDLQSLLDEKVDLVHERDAYKCKVHRLNHSMAALLKSGKLNLISRIFVKKVNYLIILLIFRWVQTTRR